MKRTASLQIRRTPARRRSCLLTAIGLAGLGLTAQSRTSFLVSLGMIGLFVLGCELHNRLPRNHWARRPICQRFMRRER